MGRFQMVVVNRDNDDRSAFSSRIQLWGSDAKESPRNEERYSAREPMREISMIVELISHTGEEQARARCHDSHVM